MTQTQAVNVPVPTTAEAQMTNELGLNLIDLAFVQLLIRNVLPTEKAEAVNKVLQNVASSLNTLASLAHVTEEIAQEALLQRNAALQEIEALTHAVQTIDQTNPDIAALVRTVWDAAQADLLKQMQSQKGA